jgi:hypothetical protein
MSGFFASSEPILAHFIAICKSFTAEKQILEKDVGKKRKK